MKYAAKTITGIRKQNQDAVFIPERGMPGESGGIPS